MARKNTEIKSNIFQCLAIPKVSFIVDYLMFNQRFLFSQKKSKNVSPKFILVL